jgi:hypothetical protein
MRARYDAWEATMPPVPVDAKVALPYPGGAFARATL